MTKREQYLMSLEKYFQHGLIKEIYGNENVSILNVCNSLYVGTLYTQTNNKNYSACILELEQVKKIVEDDKLLAFWIYNTPTVELKKVFIEFNDLTYEKMKKIKEKTDINGPSKFIDLNFEEEIKAKSR